MEFKMGSDWFQRKFSIIISQAKIYNLNILTKEDSTMFFGLLFTSNFFSKTGHTNL